MSDTKADGSAKLTQAAYWQAIQGYLQPGDVLYVDNGTSFAVLGLKLPPNCTFVGSINWGSIGYSVGALLGALTAAPDRRHILFIGDGSFQVSAQELSTILRRDHKPVIFLINNGGYTIERGYLGKSEPTTSPTGPTPICRRFSVPTPQRGRSSSGPSAICKTPSARRTTR